MKKIAVLLTTAALFSTAGLTKDLPSKKTTTAAHVLIYVWDGLRPDAVTAETTPNLYRLMQQGTRFVNNHASYPSFTMMNAASFATGDRAGKTGFFGNTLWHPGITGVDAAGNPVDFLQPVFTEDYKILQDLNQDSLFFVNTLFNAAHSQQMTTGAVGKSGAAFMQDYLSLGFTLDEKHVFPLSFAKQLQQNGYHLPKLSPNDFNAAELALTPDNGDPTAADKLNFLADNVTPDASDNHGSPYNRANEYMANIFIQEILTKQLPQLSVLWMRNPDTTEHNYGPGTANYRDALQSNDKILGKVLDALKDHNLSDKTDIIIVSDHAHSTVSAPLNQFPLRAIKNGQVDAIDPQGYSVSGEIRTAHLLTQAGFHAYDGNGCVYDPVLSGITKDGTPLYATQIDKTGEICGKADAKYITPAYKVPHNNLPADAIIVAANGGSDYFYIPSHDKEVAKKLVTFLASHSQYDAIFTDAKRYGRLNGTLPLQDIGIENPQGRSPDVVAGLAYDATAKVNGLPGIEFSDYVNMRGMHGSFSPIDVHNFLMATGPDFRSQYVDKLPTGNVDVAPTVAHILGLNLPDTDGRVLTEALTGQGTTYLVRHVRIKSAPLTQLTIYNVLGQHLPETSIATKLYVQILSDGKNKFYYFDSAQKAAH